MSLLDTACARVAVSQHATPAEVEDLRRRRQMLEVEQGIIGREAAIGIDVAARRARLDAGARRDRRRRSRPPRRAGTRERELVAQILDLRARLRGEGVPLDAAAEACRAGARRAAASRRARRRRRARAADGAPTPPTARPTSPSCAG